MNLEAIQKALADEGLDGWLFYDHHHRDPIAYRVLGIRPPMCTRRWYCLIPVSGDPVKLTHRIEAGSLDGVPGKKQVYSTWKEQHAGVAAMMAGRKRVAMEYSALNAIPYVGLVDAGTVELVRQTGVEVVSSANLVQRFEACWSDEALQTHLEAGKAIHRIVRQAFSHVASAVHTGQELNERDLQREITRLYEIYGLEAAEPPLVAVNAHSGNPHYSPTAETAWPIVRNDFLLLDIWAKLKQPGSVYFDITWTGYVGGRVPEPMADIFNIVSKARDTGVALVQQAVRSGRALHGFEVDDAVRGVITAAGYGDHFVHRTGHSIGEDVHGNGANMDNFETHDDRLILPGACFSIEPGIYLPEYGVRSEVDVFVQENDAIVTGEIQQAIVPILAAADEVC